MSFSTEISIISQKIDFDKKITVSSKDDFIFPATYIAKFKSENKLLIGKIKKQDFEIQVNKNNSILPIMHFKLYKPFEINCFSKTTYDYISKNFSDKNIVISFQELFTHPKQKAKLSEQELVLLLNKYVQEAFSYLKKENFSKFIETVNKIFLIDPYNILCMKTFVKILAEAFQTNPILNSEEFLHKAYLYELVRIENLLKKEDPFLSYIYYLIANSCFVINLVKPAIFYLKKAIKLDNNNPVLLSALGKIYKSQRKFKYSNKYLDKALEIIETWPPKVKKENINFILENLSLKFSNLIELKQYQEIIDIYKNLDNELKNSPYLRFLVAIAYLNLDNFAYGFTMLNKLLDEIKDPQFKEMILDQIASLGKDLKTAKDFQEYIYIKTGFKVEGFNKTVQEHIDVNELIKFLSKFQPEKYYLETIKFLDINLEEDYRITENKTVIEISKKVWSKSKKLSKNLQKILEEAIEKTKIPDSEKSVLISSETGESLEDIPKEELMFHLKNLMTEVEKHPEDAFLYFNIGRILNGLGEYEKALAYFDKAIELEPNIIIFYSAKALTLEKMQKLNEAIDTLKTAISYISTTPDNLFNFYEEIGFKVEYLYNQLANLLIKNGQFEEAIIALKKSLEFNVKDKMTLFLLGTCYEKKNELQEAKKYLEAALSLDPDFPYAYVKLGIVYFKEGNYPAAQTFLTSGLNIDNTITEGWYFLGLTYLELDAKEKAIEIFQTLINNFPEEDIFVKYAKEKLEELENDK